LPEKECLLISYNQQMKYPMYAEINREFIFTYLSGKSTALQKQMVDEWVKNPAHEELFYQWLVEFEIQNPQYITELLAAIDRFRVYTDWVEANPGAAVASLHPRSEKPRLAWRWLVAAGLLLGTLATGIQFRETIQYQSYDSAYGQTRTLLLSDGSRVVLNANSRLLVPRFGFGDKSREVLLSGEASFDVRHQPDHQKFVVKTPKGVDVVVLGTEFTVYSRQEKARVVLSRGKIQLRYQEGEQQKQLIMQPGDLVTMDQANKLTRKSTEQPEKFAAWQDQRFVFEDMTLRQFAELMHENYGIEVRLENDSLANRTLVGSFRADSAEELLDIVSKLFDLKLVKSENSVLLTN
jgi:transmembrane sensor